MLTIFLSRRRDCGALMIQARTELQGKTNVKVAKSLHIEAITCLFYFIFLFRNSVNERKENEKGTL